MVAGLSGTLNHFFPWWRLFNLVNGLLLPRLGLTAYELFLDLALAVLGLTVMLAAASLSRADA